MKFFKRAKNFLLDHTQGYLARWLNSFSMTTQKKIATQIFHYHYYPNLDPYLQCLFGVQEKIGKTPLIGEDYLQSRQAFEAQMQSIRYQPTSIKYIKNLVVPLIHTSLKLRHYNPEPHQSLPMLVFFHGGGFVVGSIETHDEACRLIALHAHVQVISVEYPLAPEACPMELIQYCEDALTWVNTQIECFKVLDGRVAVAGDSAGANIATVLAQRTKHKVYSPQAQLLIYPFVDCVNKYPSQQKYAEHLILTASDIHFATKYYAHHHDVLPSDPLVSPILGDLRALPATFIVSAGHDVLHDEAKSYAGKLQEQKVVVEYHDYIDQTHGFINLTFISLRAKKITIEIAEQFRIFWDQQI